MESSSNANEVTVTWRGYVSAIQSKSPFAKPSGKQDSLEHRNTKQKRQRVEKQVLGESGAQQTDGTNSVAEPAVEAVREKPKAQAVQSSSPEQGTEEVDTGTSTGSFELQLTDEWRERLLRTSARLKEKKKRIKLDTTLTVQQRIQLLEEELQHTFEIEMARLKAQISTSTT